MEDEEEPHNSSNVMAALLVCLLLLLLLLLESPTERPITSATNSVNVMVTTRQHRFDISLDGEVTGVTT
jgi:hypothetical protein